MNPFWQFYCLQFNNFSKWVWEVGGGKRGEGGGFDTLITITVTFLYIFYRRESTEGGKTCNLERALTRNVQ